ncbi:MAG: hypothetical protein ACE15D_00160 [Candidatus Eisenbacteria bacterium]
MARAKGRPPAAEEAREAGKGAGAAVDGGARAFRWIATGSILLACLLAFGGSLRYGFVSDDRHLIVDRLPSYTRSLPVADAFTSPFWKGGAYGALPGEEKDYYRPLVTLSYALDARIGGGSPRAFHATNLLLHALASLLVCSILLRLGLRRPFALAGALLFATHPVHVASVAWISGRTDLLCAVFLLLAYDRLSVAIDRSMDAGAASRASEGQAAGRWKARADLAVGLVAFVLALLSKEMAFSLPGLLLLHAWLRRSQARRAPAGEKREGRAASATVPAAVPAWPWAELAATAAAAVLLLVFRAAILGLPDLQAGARSASGSLRPAILPAAFLWYAKALLLPGALALEVSFPPVASFLDPRVLLGLPVLGATIAGAILLIRRGHAAGLGLGWIVVSLLPVSHLAPLVFRAIVTEYWLYVPSAGFALAVAAGAQSLAGSFAVRRRLPAPAIPAAVFLLALIGLFRVPARAAPLVSEEALLTRQVEADPDRVESWVSLATEYGSSGRLPEATRAIGEALRRDPRLRGAQLTLGNLFDLSGRADSAEAAYRREMAFHPESDEARLSLADMLLRRGEEGEAVVLYRDTLARGGTTSAGILDRARSLHEAAIDLRSGLAWQRREEALRLAAGMHAALEQAGTERLAEVRRLRLEELLRLDELPEATRAWEAMTEDRETYEPAVRLLSSSLSSSLSPSLSPSPPAPEQALRASPAAAAIARDLASFFAATGRASRGLPLWRGLLRAGQLTPEDLNHQAVRILQAGGSGDGSGGGVADGGAGGAEDGGEVGAGETGGDAAAAIWQMLLEERADHPLALLNLGGLAFSSGDRERCRSMWGRFLALYPDRPEAAEVREKLAAL